MPPSPTHEVATKLASRFATFKVMFAVATTPEAWLAVLKQYCMWYITTSSKLRTVRGVLLPAVQHQRLVVQHQRQPDGATEATVWQSCTGRHPHGAAA